MRLTGIFVALLTCVGLLVVKAAMVDVVAGGDNGYGKREVMLRDGIEAVGALVPPAVVARSALVGSADEIGERLRTARDLARPELFLLPLNEHLGAEAFIDRAAQLLDTAGFSAVTSQ